MKIQGGGPTAGQMLGKTAKEDLAQVSPKLQRFMVVKLVLLSKATPGISDFPVLDLLSLLMTSEF